MCFNISQTEGQLNYCTLKKIKILLQREQIPSAQGPVFYIRITLNILTLRPKIGSFQILNFNPLNPELNPICYLLALLGAHHFLHVSSIRVKSLTLRRLMSYIYVAPILDVSRSHTTTQHSR